MEWRGVAHHGGADGRAAAARAGGGLRRGRPAARAPLPDPQPTGTKPLLSLTLNTQVLYHYSI